MIAGPGWDCRQCGWVHRPGSAHPCPPTCECETCVVKRVHTFEGMVK